MARESWARKNLEMDFRQPTYMHMPGLVTKRKTEKQNEYPTAGAAGVCSRPSPAGDEVLRQIAAAFV
jgi:hypothetical protein